MAEREVIELLDEDVQPRAQPKRKRPASSPPPVPRAHGRFELTETRGDLFELAEASWSLAHCIALDMRLGRGVATEFKRRFGGVDELQAQRAPPLGTGAVGVGGVAVLRRDRRFVYGLVTKVTSSRTYPTMAALEASLVALRKHAEEHGVTHIACPRLGCGLDRLRWEDGPGREGVRSLIGRVFGATGVAWHAFSLDG